MNKLVSALAEIEQRSIWLVYQNAEGWHSTQQTTDYATTTDVDGWIRMLLREGATNIYIFPCRDFTRHQALKTARKGQPVIPAEAKA